MLMIQTCVKARMHASMRTAATTRHTASLNRYKSNSVFLRPEMKAEQLYTYSVGLHNRVREVA